MEAEAQRLRMLAGQVAVRGPGVVVVVDAPLTPIDLEDAVNNLRVSGAEAIAINDQRLVNGSVIRLHGGAIEIDGVAVRRPWTLQAIGDPTRLAAGAETMTRSLRADRRVASAGYTTDADLEIRSTVRPRPFVYGSS
jgi:uncharacterized protein YlxW (UPF0749 family)